MKNEKCETCGIKCKGFDCFLEYTNFKDNFIEYKYLLCNKNYKENLNDFLFHTNFLTITSINLLYCCEKVFIIYIWFGKIQLNFISWKRRFLQSPQHGRHYRCRLHARKKS